MTHHSQPQISAVTKKTPLYSHYQTEWIHMQIDITHKAENCR